MLEDLDERPNGLVNIHVTGILNQFQPITPTLITFEKNDLSSPASPTWLRSTNPSLEGQQRAYFLGTLNFALQQLLGIPTFTSPFLTESTINDYFKLNSDLRNMIFIYSPFTEKILVPTDSKMRRDLVRYLTVIDTSVTKVKVHLDTNSERETSVAGAVGKCLKGKLALRNVGLLAASHLRERSHTERDPPLDLATWLCLQSTGVWQKVTADFRPLFLDMHPLPRITKINKRLPSIQSLRAWAQENGHGTILLKIQTLLLLPQYSPRKTFPLLPLPLPPAPTTAPKPTPQAGIHEAPAIAAWRQHFGNQQPEKRREEKKPQQDPYPLKKRTPPWKEIQPARHPGLQPFLPQDHPPGPAPSTPRPITITIPSPSPSPIPDTPTTSQPPLSSTTSSDKGLSRKMLQQRDAQKCSPFPVPSITLTVPYSPFPIPDAPVLSQPPLTTAASTQPTPSNTSPSSETPQQEDRPKSTAAQPPLLRWALSVPGLEEPVDLTVDLRAQTPGT